MTVLLGAAPSIIGPSEVGAWMAARGAPGAAALLDFAGQKYGFRSATRVPRWGSVAADMTFARASAGGRWPATGPFEMVGSVLPRFDHDPSTRAPKGVLIENAGAPISTYTADISAWAGVSNFPSVTNRTSIFAGGVAVEHFAPSNFYRSQAYTLAASTDYRLDLVVERGVGTAAPPGTWFGLYRAGWVGLAYYDWNSNGIGLGAGAASGFIAEQLGTGPNGGKLVRISCVVPSGAGGATSLFFYPVGTSGSVAGQSAIVHYACVTPGTLYRSMMIVQGSAQTRASDVLTSPLFCVPSEGFTIAFRARMPFEGPTGDAAQLFNLLPPTGTAERIGVETYGGVGSIWYSRYPTGFGTQTQRMALGIPLGGEFYGAISWSASQGYRGTSLGGALVSNAGLPAPSTALSRITFGSRNGTATWGSTIKRIAIWPHGEFTDAEMQELLA